MQFVSANVRLVPPCTVSTVSRPSPLGFSRVSLGNSFLQLPVQTKAFVELELELELDRAVWLGLGFGLGLGLRGKEVEEGGGYIGGCSRSSVVALY